MVKPKPGRALAAVPIEEFSPTANWMIYGLTGVGKTSLAAGLASNTFISPEPGIVAAKRRAMILQTDPRVVKVRNWEDCETALVQAERGDYDSEWITLDTLTTMQILMYRYWTGKQNDANPLKYDVDIADLAGHFKVQMMTRRYISRWVDTDYNVLVLCHAMQTEDNDGSGLWLPAIEGQAKKGHLVAQYCMGLMNAVGYMGITTDEKDREHRRIVWQHTHDRKKDIIYTAKEQYGGALGRYTDDLEMPQLLALTERPVKPKKKKAPKTIEGQLA
jgi:hypothetical protein